MPSCRIVIADDLPAILEQLCQLLEEHHQIVGAVSDGARLVQAASDLKPDLVITDVSMPVLSGIEAARQIRSESAEVRLIFVTMHSSPKYLSHALEAGANGYVLKAHAAEELMMAVEVVMNGGTYISSSLSGCFRVP